MYNVKFMRICTTIVSVEK